jgi:hypothetical protein
VVEIVRPDEPGERWTPNLKLADRDTCAPLAGRRVALHRTDAASDFCTSAKRPGEGADNPRSFAYLRTDAHGRCELRSIVPAPCRGTRRPAHVRIRVERPDAQPPRNGDPPRKPTGDQRRARRKCRARARVHRGDRRPAAHSQDERDAARSRALSSGVHALRRP